MDRLWDEQKKNMANDAGGALVHQMVRQFKVHTKHAKSLLSGKAAKRFEWLSETQLVSAMAAIGAAAVCRVVKASDDERDFAERIKKAMTA